MTMWPWAVVSRLIARSSLLPLATGEKKTLFSMMTSLAVWTLTPMNWLPALEVLKTSTPSIVTGPAAVTVVVPMMIVSDSRASVPAIPWFAPRIVTALSIVRFSV